MGSTPGRSCLRSTSAVRVPCAPLMSFARSRRSRARAAAPPSHPRSGSPYSAGRQACPIHRHGPRSRRRGPAARHGCGERHRRRRHTEEGQAPHAFVTHLSQGAYKTSTNSHQTRRRPLSDYTCIALDCFSPLSFHAGNALCMRRTAVHHRHE